MKKILLLGGAGFIGSNLAKKMIQLNWSVFIYEPPAASVTNLASVLHKVIIIRGTLSTVNDIIRFVEQNNIRVVVHLVSTLIPNSPFERYRDELKDILLPTIDLIHVLSKKKVKFVFLSSGGTVYGENNKHIPFLEDDNLKPICYYGESKLFIEQAIKLENRYTGLDYLIVRPSNPYGAAQKLGNVQGFIASILGKALKGEKVVIWGDGKIVRDYIFIDDLTFALCTLIETDKSGEFNIGSGKGYSLNEVIEIVNSYLTIPLDVEYTAGRKIDIPFLVLDISKLKNEISFQPTSLQNGIEYFLSYIEKSWGKILSVK